jgi:hypothetical protein
MLATASQLSPKDATEAFRMFISWGVRLIVASNTSRGAVEEPLADTANRVFIGAVLDAASLKNEVADIIPVVEEFHRAFEIATSSKAALARYYLRSLEMAAKSEAQLPHQNRPGDDPKIARGQLATRASVHA